MNWRRFEQGIVCSWHSQFTSARLLLAIKLFLLNIIWPGLTYGCLQYCACKRMAYLLQFCGVTDPLQLFYLEQRNLQPQECHQGGEPAADQIGPAFGGFRPFQLDDLLGWAQDIARGRHWDREAIQRTVLDVWMERAEVICQWQMRLRQEPAGRLLVAGIGTAEDWSVRCERLLRD